VPTCPSCNLALLIQHGRDGVRHPCAQCGGLEVTLSILQAELPFGTADAAWRSANTGPSANLPCPACGKTMVVGHVPAGQPTDNDWSGVPIDPAGVPVAVCKDCEVFWMSAESRGHIQHQAPADVQGHNWEADPRPTPLRCEYCGGPYAVDHGRCKWCRRQLVDTGRLFS
jgi:hypothetical protein